MKRNNLKLTDFKEWYNHFKKVDLKAPKVAVIKYGSKQQFAYIRMYKEINGIWYEHCNTKDYTTKVIEKFMKELE